MNLWLIEVIHNIDIICNVIFWLLPALALMGYRKSPYADNTINTALRWIWLVAVLGVIFIPSERVLRHLLG